MNKLNRPHYTEMADANYIQMQKTWGGGVGAGGGCVAQWLERRN